MFNVMALGRGRLRIDLDKHFSICILAKLLSQQTVRQILTIFGSTMLISVIFNISPNLRAANPMIPHQATGKLDVNCRAYAKKLSIINFYCFT